MIGTGVNALSRLVLERSTCINESQQQDKTQISSELSAAASPSTPAGG